MLMGRCMKDHRWMILFKHFIQALFIPDAAHQHQNRNFLTILLAQFHLQFIGTVLINVKYQQLPGLEPHDLTAQL